MKVGDKVVFKYEKAGYEHHQVLATAHLVLGQEYVVSKVHIGGWHTDVWVEGIPNRAFNSVMFKWPDDK